MQMNKLTRKPVGADLSRTQPIYRPLWLSRYPNYFVKTHYRGETLLYYLKRKKV